MRNLTGEDARAIREALGYTNSEIKNYLKIPRLPNYQAMEKNQRTIKDEFSNKLVELLENERDIEEGAKKLYEKYRQAKKVVYFVLKATDPQQNAIIKRAFILLTMHHVETHLISFNADDYNKFLEETGLPHSNSTMELWAEDYHVQKRYLDKRYWNTGYERKTQPEEPKLFKWQYNSHHWDNNEE